MHVYHAACRTGSAILTTDAGLWLGCRECNVPAFLPLEWIRTLNGVALQTTIFGISPTASAGSLFVRAYPGQWAGGRAGKFTLANFPGGFWLYYDACEACWVAAVSGLSRRLKCNTRLQDSSLQTVCLSWDSDTSKPKIDLRVAGVEHPDSAPLSGPLDFRPSGYPTVGCAGGVSHFWNGSIYFCISNDRPVGSTSWKKYLAHRELAPNPYDADKLANALRSL